MASDLEYTGHINTNTMTATLTAPMGTWFTSLRADTQADITDMVNEAGYPLHDIQEFVETHGEEAYCDGHYVAWCELTERGHDTEAIEAYVDEVGIDAIENFEEAYMGEYDGEAEFAEEYYTDIMCVTIPDTIVVDWQATWDGHLRYDYVYNNGYVFNTNV